MKGRDDERKRSISIGFLGSGEGVFALNSKDVHSLHKGDSALDTRSCGEISCGIFVVQRHKPVYLPLHPNEIACEYRQI